MEESTNGGIKRLQAKSGRWVPMPNFFRSFWRSDLECQCTTMDNFLVAHYDLKHPNIRVYDVSGHNLIIYEAFAHMCAGMIPWFQAMNERN